MASKLATIEMDRDDMPIMFPVDSGMASEIGHDVFSGDLFVVFAKNGKIARYSNVDRDAFFDLKDAESIRTYLFDNIVGKHETVYVELT